MNGSNLPREVVPGLFWLGTCNELTFGGAVIHSPYNAFLVKGTRHSIMIDTGAASGWPTVRRQLAAALAGRPLDYVFPTHPEKPHMGNLERLLGEYPGLRVVGDVRNYHLYFPGESGRMEQLCAGDHVDLGDRNLFITEAAIRDLPNTLWAYDSACRALFVSDGFGYSHAHGENQCALTAEELPGEPTVEHTAWITFNALSWAPYVDPRRYFQRLDRVMGQHPPGILCPAHGSVSLQPERMMPIMKQGLIEARFGKASEVTS